MEGELTVPQMDLPQAPAKVRGRTRGAAPTRHRTPHLSLLPDAVKRRYAPNWRRTLLVTGLFAVTVLAVGYGAVLVVSQQSARMRAAILRSEIAGYAAGAGQARHLEREILAREVAQAHVQGRASGDGSAFLTLLRLAPQGVSVQSWQQAGQSVQLSFTGSSLGDGLRYASALSRSPIVRGFALVSTSGSGPVTFDVAFQLGVQP